MPVRVADKIKQFNDADFFLMDAEDVEMSDGKSVEEKFAEKGKPNGYAGLDKDGKIPTEQLPPIAITETYVVNTQAAMLALSAQVGDVAIRTDLSKSFILQNEPASILANWQELLTPTDLTTIQSVLLTGLSTATNSAITASDTIIKAFGKLQAQINARLPLKGGTMTGDIVMDKNKITSSAIPSDACDYTNKQYVDNAIANANATMLECEINDSDGGALLDSNGQQILSRVNVINAITDINETIEKLKQHAILDSTF